MRTQSFRLILAYAISLLLMVLLLSVLPAASQEITTGGGTRVDAFNIAEGQALDAVTVPLVGTAITTKTVEIMIPFGIYRYLYEADITGMAGGTYTWYMDYFPPGSISDVVFTWAGNTGCIQQADQNIVCGSGITRFHIQYRYTGTYQPASNYILFGAGDWAEGFAPDHIATLRYLEPMEFVSSIHWATGSPITPIVNTDHTLTWQIPAVTDAFIIATIYDPRIHVVYLPAVKK